MALIVKQAIVFCAQETACDTGYSLRGRRHADSAVKREVS
jgi:hypothetical protein